MQRAVFELAIPAIKRLQTNVLDSTASWIDIQKAYITHSSQF
jgi:hypothetical protein